MSHGGHDQHHHGEKDHKLYLIKSPVVGEGFSSDSATLRPSESRGDIEGLGYRDSDRHDCPEFEKHEEATNTEVFYDLFFAANLTVFSDVHDITNSEQLVSYIGYYCILWFTWGLVGLFDVRFVTDSIFERCARAMHLGVMVGFAVVAANFNPSVQIRHTFRAMSIILMASRLTMAVQYGSILWHVRRYAKTRLPLILMIALNTVAALIYLGINFAFTDSNTRIYITWYVVGASELVLTAVMSLFWKVLSFEGTHLIQRMSLLTFIIIGEGIIVVCTNITLIVKNANSWTPPTIGVVTAGVATIYIVYMIYFDWMRHLHLPKYRQLIWAVLHFPFHLALTLFVEGSAQFVLWYKIMEVIGWFNDLLLNALDGLAQKEKDITASDFTNLVNETLTHVFELYPPKFQDTVSAVETAFHNLVNISAIVFDPSAESMSDDDPRMQQFGKTLEDLLRAVFNSLLANFDIEGFTSAGENNFTGTEDQLQESVFNEDWSRFETIFYYAFISAGVVLLLMNVLFLVSRTTRLTPWNYFRSALNTLIALGLCLLTLINLDPDKSNEYVSTPWVLPTICLVFFIVLVVNHLPHPPPIFFRKRQTAHHPAEGSAFLADNTLKYGDNVQYQAQYQAGGHYALNTPTHYDPGASQYSSQVQYDPNGVTYQAGYANVTTGYFGEPHAR